MAARKKPASMKIPDGPCYGRTPPEDAYADGDRFLFYTQGGMAEPFAWGVYEHKGGEFRYDEDGTVEIQRSHPLKVGGRQLKSYTQVEGLGVVGV